MFNKFINENVNIGSITLDVIVLLSISLNQFGYFSSIFGLFGAALISLLSCGKSSKHGTVLSTWLHLLEGVCCLSIAADGLSVLLDYMNGTKPHSYIHLIPTSTMPGIMPITVLAVLTALFMLGLEANTILDTLTKFFLFGAVILFMTIGAFLMGFDFAEAHKIPEDALVKVVACSAFFRRSFSGGKKKTEVQLILIKLIIYLAIMIMLIALPKAKCAMFALICPISNWYRWYEPAMVCLTISALCLALTPLFSSALNTLLVPGKINIPFFMKENQTTGTHLRAICVIGILSSALVCVQPLYNLILLSSASVLLGLTFDIVFMLDKQFQPIFIPRKGKKKISKYFTLRTTMRNSADGCSDKATLVSNLSEESDSTDTDIDTVVAEYKQSLRVKATNFRKFHKDPTVSSGRMVSILVSLVVVGSTCFCVALLQQAYLFSITFLLGTLFLGVLIYSQPQQEEKKVLTLAFILRSIFSFTLHLLLLFSILVESGFWLLVWGLGGAFYGWYREKQKKIKKTSLPGLKLSLPPGPYIIGHAQQIQRASSLHA